MQKKQFQLLAQKLLDKSNPAEYNQAIMEFGALQCIPKSPKCESCSFNNECVAFTTNEVLNLPIKSKKIRCLNKYTKILFEIIRN